MKHVSLLVILCLNLFGSASIKAQVVTNWLPGRNLAKLLPDYLRPKVYALNMGDGKNPGTLLALNATNGATLNEISVNLNPTDMAITPAGDTLYVINAGSRTISKVNLTTFTVVAEQAISTPNSYSLSNPLYVVAGQSGKLYYTDGAWGPEIYFFDFNSGTNLLVLNTGGNQDFGAGGMVLNRAGNTLYVWKQYGWGAGSVNSWVTRYVASTNGNLTALEDSFSSWRRDPIDTQLFLDSAERWVFNKEQMFAATNVSVLLNQFSDNLYAISLDGSLAFGPTEVYNTQNGALLTNLTFASTVQALSGDQQKLFRYQTSTSNLYVYDMAAIAPVSGPSIVPTPADGIVVGLPPAALSWTVSPYGLAYDVYFGTNQSQVSAATQATSQYLGRVNTTSQPLTRTLSPGATYYWRVDIIGFSVTNTGPTWSFTVSSLAISPTSINLDAIAGYSPPANTLSLTSAVPQTWTAAVKGAGWLSLGSTRGTSPSTLAVQFNTATLAPGFYTNDIEVTVGAQQVHVPVVVNIKPLNILKMATDYQRPYVYALQAPAASGQNGLVLFINTTNHSIENTVPVGINPVDFTINYAEGRLYVASWTENNTYVVDLTTQTLLPSLHLGTDIYKINAAGPGRIITEGEDQWIAVNIVDTTTGSVVAPLPYPEREGDGATDPTGNFYYHCDNNISDAHIHKYSIAGAPTEVADSLQHPYGTRNLVLAPDGSTLFWNGFVYDANLDELGSLGEEIYATTAHGDLAFGGQHVFNSRNGQTVYTWPFWSTAIAISGDQLNVFLFNSASNQLTVIPMSAIASVPQPGLNPTPADGAVINPPLSQILWTPSPFALSYLVFMGTNQAAVASADTNSAVYLGVTSTNAFSLPLSITPGLTYFWRVDSVGFSGIATGSVWAFTASGLTISPQTIALAGVTGLPMLPHTISVGAPLSASWNLTIANPWLTASTNGGATPSTVTLNFDTTNLAAGVYSNQLTFTSKGIALQLPVVVQLFDLNASKMAADPNRNYIYALHPGSGSFADAFLLFLNTDTGVVERVIPIGTNPTDLSVNRFEDRLYVSNWQHNQTRVVDLKTQTELAPLALGTDVYKINASFAGQIVIEGEDQWVYATLVNTRTGSNITSTTVSEGDGECDPSGRYYYHVDDNDSGAVITKLDIGNNAFVFLTNAAQHYYFGSRNLVMSLDGSRLFWTSAMYDANLVDLGVLGAELYACSTNGSIAFSDHQAFDTAAKQVIYNLPVTSTVGVVDRMDQRFWYFNSATHRIESILTALIRVPSITQQPAASTPVGVGQPAYLSVTAMGLNPLSYQWLMSGTNLPGATNYFLALNNIQPYQQGGYQIIVHNGYGSVTSTVAQVTVLIPPALTSQPMSTNVLAGQPFSLSIEASGSAPLSYQWFFQGGALAGATNSSLVVADAQIFNEGAYNAVIANLAGSVTSSLALVRILPAVPSILSAPHSLTVPASSNVTFSVAAAGSEPLSYQWLFNGKSAASAGGPQLLVSDAQLWNSGTYQVIVANSGGAVTSVVATLTVTPAAPYFVIQPAGASIPAGTNLLLSAQAAGTEPIAYQWLRDRALLPGANQSSLALSNLAITQSGNYALMASNSAGISTSMVASVVVTASPPVFVQQPASSAALTGSSVTLLSLAQGSAPLWYQWFFSSNSLPAATNAQLTLSAVTAAQAGAYFVIATNHFGSATSAVAQLTINTPATVTQGLTNRIVTAGDLVTLIVQASGSGSLAYSWQLNGMPLAALASSLTISNIQPGQSGYYQVTISNAFGIVSSTARISVFGPASHVVAWGDDSGGQSDVPTNLNTAVLASGGDYHSLALRPEGSLVAWGFDGDGQTEVPTNGERYVGIACGANHNLAITQNGSVVAWGRDNAGQTDVPATVSSALSVAAGEAHSMALLAPGNVVVWGDNSYGQLNLPPSLLPGGFWAFVGGQWVWVSNNPNPVQAIAAGRNHNLALLTGGTVVAWGNNAFGQASPPAALSNVVAVAAGDLHSAALLANGTIIAWGDNSYGQLNVPAGLSNVIAIAAGDFHTLALKADQTIVAWGNNWYDQITVPGSVVPAFGVASGYYHSLALVSPAPRLIPNLTRSGLVIQWSQPGIMQWAPSPLGPFTDISGPLQAYTNTDWSSPMKFFRVRGQ